MRLSFLLIGFASTLLQHVSASNTDFPVEVPFEYTSAPQAASWLGWGRWVAREDFWTMQTSHGESLFARHMPGSCFREAECRHVHGFKSEQFDTVETWSDYYSNLFGLGFSGGYGGFSA